MADSNFLTNFAGKGRAEAINQNLLVAKTMLSLPVRISGEEEREGDYEGAKNCLSYLIADDHVGC